MDKIKSLLQRLIEYIKTLWNKLREQFRQDMDRPLGVVKLTLLGILIICLLMLCLMTRQLAKQEEQQLAAQKIAAEEAAEAARKAALSAKQEEESAEETAAPAETPTLTAEPEFSPAGDSSRILSTLLQVDGSYADSYTAAAEDEIDFPRSESYSSLQGITTFRGDNFRSSAQLGLVDFEQKNFGDYWSFKTEGAESLSGESLSGSGYTGQPLAACWSAQDKANMNLYEWAEEKEELTEIIYPSLDGSIYFLDLETGSPTRESVKLPVSFSSGGTLDPRGYPLLYIGGGTPTEEGAEPTLYIISLLDGSVLYSLNANSDFAVHWNGAFNAAPLVDASSDSLVFSGGNGVLYILKLNSNYDSESGELSVSPEERVQWKYTTEDAYGYGVSSSPVAWQGHLIMADRGGNLLCLDLNTMQVDWCADSLDITRCSPVLQIEDGHPYLYLSTSFHYGLRAYYQQSVPVWKLDAETGEIIWQTDFECFTKDGADGGVMGTVALGSGSLDEILYVSVARYPTEESGTLYALDSQTGEELWHFETSYGYASPTCFYDTEGNGYVIQISREDGCVYLLDGLTGQLYDMYIFDVTMESSPIVCGNYLVTGSSEYYLLGIELK